ncbi:hypothetical protein BDQ17DRAFT_1385066 [Cyathus striatus]|nr:hypothetical protein BDQ17DRAFT_1385066 [Cyathus striatus]
MDPDPQRPDTAKDFLSKHKGLVIGGFIVLAVLLIGSITGLVRWRRRRQVRYHKLKGDRDVRAVVEYELPVRH